MNNRILLVLPYRLTRLQLSFLDTHVARRLADESRGHLLFDRALGTFDQVAGRLLKNTSIAQQGTERVARVENIESASLLEQQAADLRRSATETARAGEREAAEKADQARDTALSGAAAARAVERDGTRAATATARKQAARDKQQAETRAQQRATVIEQGRKQAVTSASARTARAKKDARTALTAVGEERRGAAAKRRDADQLGELSTAKRRSRTTS